MRLDRLVAAGRECEGHQEWKQRTVNGGAFANAMVNKGWKSNGQTSVIKVPNAAVFYVTKFTVDFWIKVAALNQGNTVAVWKGNSYGQDKTSPYGIVIRGANPANNPFPGVGGMVIFLIGNQVTSQHLQSTSPLPLNQFKHITVTADGSTLRLYIDGSEDVPAAVPQTLIPVNSSAPLQIGGVAGSFYPNTSLNGVIDELEIFNRALDPTPKSEIMAIFQAGPSGKCKV
jgi:Concanavalin A-like lectin/glucanases superfamily